MATTVDQKVEKAPEENAPKKKKRLLLIAAGLVVLLAVGGGGAAFFIMSGKHDKKSEQANLEKLAQDGEDEEADGHDGGGEDGGKKKKVPVFFTMEPFVVNLAGDMQRYLQVGVDLKLSKEEYSERIKEHMPEIRNGVVLLLSSKQADELATVEGKNRLRVEIRQAVNEPLGIRPSTKRKNKSAERRSDQGEGAKADKKDVPPKRGVIDVLLTSFVIQ